MCSPGHEREGHTQQHARRQAVQEIVAQIDQDRRAKDRLRSQRKRPLQRHEDHNQNDQSHTKPEHVDQKCSAVRNDTGKHRPVLTVIPRPPQAAAAVDHAEKTRTAGINVR
jgi:hypothetical protein